jgi:hypothetical protein
MSAARYGALGPRRSSPGAAGTATTWSRAPDCIYDRASFLLDQSVGPAAPSRGIRRIYGLTAPRAGYCDRSSTRSMHPNGSPLDHRLWWRLRSRRRKGSLPLPLHPSRKSSTNCRSSDYLTSRLDSSSSGRKEIPTESLSFATFSSFTFRL